MAQILIFEDDLEFATLLRESLEDTGHTVLLSRQSDRAFQMMVSGEVDLALVDIFIQSEGARATDGGFVLLGRLYARRHSLEGRKEPKIPIIAMSGGFRIRELGDIDRYAREYGADVTLTKPFRVETLLDEIDALLGNQPAWANG